MNTSATSAAITINTDQAVTIANSTIESRGPLIVINGTGSGANVTVTNTTGIALDPQVRGKIRGAFITANDVSSLVVRNNSMAGVSFGIKVLSSTVSKLQIDNNYASNMEDRESNGSGGLLSTRPDLGHFVILNAVMAPEGADIGWNKVVDTIGASSNEDVFNFYKSQGSAAAPITAHDNYMEGYSSTTTPGYSGTGLITDGDTNTPVTAYVLIENNDMVHTAGSGVEIASGHNITVRGNRVVSCGRDSNGSWFAMPFANAANLWNYVNAPNFYSNTIETTAGGLVRPSGSGSPMVADSWIDPANENNNNAITNNAFTDPCMVNGQLDLQAETTERSYYASRVSAAAAKVGDLHESLVQQAQ